MSATLLSVIDPISRQPTRTVPRPALTMDLADVTFLHWRYAPEVVRPLLPPGIRPDLDGGLAWVGLVLMRVTQVRPAGAVPMPYVGRFGQANVRLYGVDGNGRRGVVFRSNDVGRLVSVGVARLALGLPYHWSALRVERAGSRVTYDLRRRWPGPPAVGRLTVAVGAPVRPDPVDDFLTARWGLHGRWAGRQIYVRMAHEPWPIHAAELVGHLSTQPGAQPEAQPEGLPAALLAAAGLPAPAEPPRVRFSPGVTARLSRPYG